MAPVDRVDNHYGRWIRDGSEMPEEMAAEVKGYRVVEGEQAQLAPVRCRAGSADRRVETHRERGGEVGRVDDEDMGGCPRSPCSAEVYRG